MESRKVLGWAYQMAPRSVLQIAGRWMRGVFWYQSQSLDTSGGRTIMVYFAWLARSWWAVAFDTQDAFMTERVIDMKDQHPEFAVGLPITQHLMKMDPKVQQVL